MKTICFVVPSFPALTKTFVTNQIIAIKSKGYDVIILTHQLNEISRSSQAQLIRDNDLLRHVIVINYKIPENSFFRIIKGLPSIVRYFKCWLSTPNISLRHRFINLPYLIKFYSQFRQVSVFHIQFINSGQGVAEMKENGLLCGDIITTFHGYDTHNENEERFIFLKNRYKTLMKESKYFTVNTKYLVSKVKNLGADQSKIHIIPMGINTAFFKNNREKSILKHEKINLISVGRLIELKGYHYAIKAIKDIVEKGYNVRYVIVGEGKMYEELNSLIDQLKLNDYVFLIGNKSQIEIRELYAESHVFLMSSVTDKLGRAEAQGLVTAEAQAMGLPVVAFNSGGVSDTILVNKSGFLVDEKNYNDFANAIEMLIVNSEIYKTMSKEARNFAELHFSEILMSERFVKLYNA